MPSNDYALITCPQCQRSLPPKMVNCQFCGASLASVARPTFAKRQVGPEPWVLTLYYVVAGYWIFGGVKEIITDALALVNLQSKAANSPLAGFSFILYIMMAVGAFQLALGTGLLLKWEWARAVVNFFCWIRILFGLLGLYASILSVTIAGPMAALYIFLNVLDIVMAGLQIWLIGETDNSFAR